MPPSRILILSDGRPGHFNLSEGITAALERLGPAETSRLDIRRGRWPGAVLAGFTLGRLPAPAMLRLVYGIDEPHVPPFDIIVSAGAETLAASVWLARARAVPNIFYGSLRLFSPTDFRLVLTSYARNATLPRHALALKPSRLDPGKRQNPVPPADAASRAQPKILGMLVGGDAGPITYREQDWATLLAFIEQCASERGTKWLVANSRRTPDHISDQLAKLAQRAGSPITRFLDVRAVGAGTLSTLLLACDGAICTADSSSMISECVWAQLPTLALSPRAFELTKNESDYRAWMSDQGWLRSLPLADIALGSYAAALSSVTPMQHNPQQALAELLKNRLGGTP